MSFLPHFQFRSWREPSLEGEGLGELGRFATSFLSKSDGDLVLPQVVGKGAKGGDRGRDLGAIHGC